MGLLCPDSFSGYDHLFSRYGADTEMKKQLLLLGGGHAHLVTLANIRLFVDKGYGVTVVQPSEYHYYSGMGPGVLGGTYRADEIRFATRKIVESSGGTFILDRGKHIDPYAQCVSLEKSNKQIQYDVLSCNTGSHVPTKLSGKEGEGVIFAKPIEKLLAGRQLIQAFPIQKSKIVAVVGSGPSAIEIAGNIHQLCTMHSQARVCIKLFAGVRFMAGQPQRLRLLARRILERKGVEIIEGDYVSKVTKSSLLLDNGEAYQADVIFIAVGVQPSSIFSCSDLPVGPDGGLLVNEYLQSTRHDTIFGGGDCIFFEHEPLAKVGVYAVRQNSVLFHNLMSRLEGQTMKKFQPGGDYLRIYNLGDGDGLLSKRFITFSGKLAFSIKDYIDRRFIVRFS